MDKDRLEGIGKKWKGKAKKTLGKITGNKELEAEGIADEVAGEVQNTVGTVKDSFKK